ncbi:MAG: hypothetical protein [Circular genetic element sp.]|nr:MAG: hypothetical protein [Circular genetic element sp.]
MAKSDSFFIRAKVTSNGGTYAQSEIDLGSFVNLGVTKSTLLRIHNISVQYADASAISSQISNGLGDKISWQLTTQTQSDLVYADDKSVVGTGALALGCGQIAPDGSATADFATNTWSQAIDIAPQDWTNGYLVGVDSMFLGVDMYSTLDTGDVNVCIVMECTLENATQASATALALSQQ